MLESLGENRSCVELKVARGRKANFGKEGKCLLLLLSVLYYPRPVDWEEVNLP